MKKTAKGKAIHFITGEVGSTYTLEASEEDMEIVARVAKIVPRRIVPMGVLVAAGLTFQEAMNALKEK